MNVLVVHDRIDIGNRIVELVKLCCSQASVTFCEDGSSARAKLSESYFDLLILDLTLPMVKGRAAPGFVVAEGLLEDLFSGVHLMTPGNTLGITQDRSALETVQNNIGPHLMAIIEQSDLTNWEDQLSDRVRYVHRSIDNRTASLLGRHDFDVLVIAALDKELDAYTKNLEMTPHPNIEGVDTYIFTDNNNIPRKGACYAIGRAGQPSASSETQGLLCQLRPKLAIMVGFCGGIPTKANLGDILIADSSMDWDYGKWKPGPVASRLYARPEPVVIRNSKVHRLSRRMISAGFRNKTVLDGEFARLSKGEITETIIQLAPFASGSAVIGDSEVVSAIRQLNDAITGVDMESYGFYYACRYPHAAKLEFVCIKAVADDCGVDKDDRLHEACCYASSFIAKEIISNWDF